MFGQNWSSVEKKDYNTLLECVVWKACSARCNMYHYPKGDGITSSRMLQWISSLSLTVLFHSYFALQSFSNCKRPLKSVLLMTALFEYFLFIIWLIRYSQKLKFACNKWGERTPQCIYSSQKNYDITVVLFACHLTLHPLNGQYWLLGCSHTSWTCCQATELSPADRKSMGRMAPG